MNELRTEKEYGYGIPPIDEVVNFRFTDLEGKELVDFDYNRALAALIMKGEIQLNDKWWYKEVSEELRKSWFIGLICNDLFALFGDDFEEILFSELEDLWNCHVKDPKWGTAFWCIKKRNQRPRQRVYEAIQKGGIWNLDEMNLPDIPI